MRDNKINFVMTASIKVLFKLFFCYQEIVKLGTIAPPVRQRLTLPPSFVLLVTTVRRGQAHPLSVQLEPSPMPPETAMSQTVNPVPQVRKRLYDYIIEKYA